MLAFLGGTGPEGKGLALRLALAGAEVIIGSRDAARAASAAAEVSQILADTVDAAAAGRVTGGDNLTAAAQADTAFITVPYAAQRPLLESLAPALAGKVVVNVIAPMRFVRGVGAVAVPVDAGSAAQESQSLLPDVLIAAAFQNVSAEELLAIDHPMDGDVIVCADHPAAKQRTMELAANIPRLRPVDGGGLGNARYVEQLTPLLVNINRIYKIHAGIRIVGL